MSSLAALKRHQVEEDDYDCLEPDYLPEPLGPPMPRPGSPGYTHFVFYDEGRFQTEADRNGLLQSVRDRFAPELEWVLSPATAYSLPTAMRFYAANHTKHFRQHGFVAELEPPRFNSGPTHTRSELAQASWDALCTNAVLAEALVDSCLKLPQRQRGNLVFGNIQHDALSYVLGRTDEDDETHGQDLLAYYQGLLVAPRKFNFACTAYPADPITIGSAVTLGRKVLAKWTSDDRRAIRRRMDREIRAWSDRLGPGFSADGLVLQAAQTLGVLRLEATELRFRERLRYIISGEPEFADDERGASSKSEYVRQEVEKIWDGLNPRTDAFVIRRPYSNAWLNTKSALAGGIGLSDEVSHDELPSYDRLGCSDGCLQEIAGWVGRLKRFHTARLTGSLATLLEEIVTDEFRDIDPDHRGVARAIKGQLPIAVWNRILEEARQHEDDGELMEVRYIWNDNPLDIPTVEIDGDVVVIYGPLLTTSVRSQQWWAEKAELFRERRTLTV